MHYRLQDIPGIFATILSVFRRHIIRRTGTAVAQWLRYCATNRKIAGSIRDGVIGIFH
jgi:hypothetical protein